MAHWEMEGQAGEQEGPFFPDGRRKPDCRIRELLPELSRGWASESSRRKEEQKLLFSQINLSHTPCCGSLPMYLVQDRWDILLLLHRPRPGLWAHFLSKSRQISVFSAVLPLWGYGLEKITLDPLHPMMLSQGLGQ